MKKLILPFLFLYVFTGCNNQPKVNYAEETGNKTALQEIKEKEPKAIEAIITEANVLYISVADDGTKRDGLAGYFCQILNEHNASCNWVKVVAVNTSSEENGFGVLLGESKCR